MPSKITFLPMASYTSGITTMINRYIIVFLQEKELTCHGVLFPYFFFFSLFLCFVVITFLFLIPYPADKISRTQI